MSALWDETALAVKAGGLHCLAQQRGGEELTVRVLGQYFQDCRQCVRLPLSYATANEISGLP